ncbi:TrmH family RNA methyltransferase [Balneola sp. MJW-20]|uniref:TrmH family RNA methyltransferase n=1 Tax=Gracilimonas aurantiaca TaxID=3234185 RepID=UPI0034662279
MVKIEKYKFRRQPTAEDKNPTELFQPMKSASNKEIKLLRKLAKKKYRDRENMFIVEGERAVEQVLDNGIIEIKGIFISEEILRSDYPAKCKRIEHELFLELADTEQTQGILALCRKPDEPNIDQIMNQDSGMILATDAIQDPGNMGTLIRTASWYGAMCLLAGHGSVDIFNPKVVRSTAGATGTVPGISAHLPEIFKDFKDQGWEILLLDGSEESVEMTDIKVPEKYILVVGNEGNGIQSILLNSSYTKVRIPRKSPKTWVESLNAGIAAAVAMYHFSRG